MSSSKLPVKTARSDTVRKYIADVLLTRYDAAPQLANEIAGLWKVGRGRELCEARREQLEKIFGTNFGLCIFRSVRDDEDNDWTQSYTAIFSNCKDTPLRKISAKILMTDVRDATMQFFAGGWLPCHFLHSGKTQKWELLPIWIKDDSVINHIRSAFTFGSFWVWAMYGEPCLPKTEGR